MAKGDRLALAVLAGAVAIPDAGDVLVLRAASSEFLDLVPPDRLRCVQTFRPPYDALIAEGRRVATRAERPAAMVVVNLTRSRAESLGNVAIGLGLLPPGGRLVVAGAKGDGVDSLARAVGEALPVGGSFAKAHGRVFWLVRPERLPEAVEAWARAAAPAENAEGFVTAPGMFSPEHADPGSRRLAEAVAGRLAGRVADLGAGWGWLARAALESNPGIAELDLHEAELVALDAARLNVADPRARFHWSDATRLGAGAGPYDAVIMNPPFHQGRAAEPDLGAAFIAASARMLKPHGRLMMVANRQLPYEAVLDAGFRRWTKLGEEGGYKLFEAEGPRRR
jgi:16S rRNA (guanine1207-N2)-methyltransferase